MDATLEIQNNYEWIELSEVLNRIPVKRSKSTVRRWIDEGKYGIISAKFGGRIVVRADTIPKIETIK